MKNNVRETSIKALRENRIKLGHSQMEVFRAFLELGPMHDSRVLEFLRQREKLKSRFLKRHAWENSNICGRRNQLINKGLIVDLGSFVGQWNGERKTYHLWAVWNDDRPVPAGWEPVEVDGEEFKKVNSEKRMMAETLFN